MENYLNFMWPFGSMNSNVSMGGIDQTNVAQDIQRPILDAYQRSPHRGFEEMKFQETVTEPQEKGSNFPGILGFMKNMFQGAGDKLGMTQVSDADRAANQEFMQQTGIGINPQTGRMYGGNWNEASQDFAGKNAPGTSGWGSANFGEMAQAWDEKYGGMEYATQKMKDKQARIKAQAIEYAQKLKADKIAADAAKAAPATGGDWRPSQPGGATLSQLQSPAGNYAAARARTSSRVGPGGNVRAYGLAQGGRVGYNRGGRVGILAAF